MPQAATATGNHPAHAASTHSANAANPHNHKPADNSDRTPEANAPGPNHPDTSVSNDRHPVIANRHTASAPTRRHASTRATTHRALSNLRTRTERGAATAEYAITIVGACAAGGLLVSLLKSPGMQNALKSIINYGLKMAGVEGVHL